MHGDTRKRFPRWLALVGLVITPVSDRLSLRQVIVYDTNRSWSNCGYISNGWSLFNKEVRRGLSKYDGSVLWSGFPSTDSCTLHEEYTCLTDDSNPFLNLHSARIH